MSALKIVRVHHEEDVFAADETKVHTLSSQVISEMLVTAERQEAASSAPPPPESGVRAQGLRTSRPAPTQSGMMPKIPAAAAVPIIANDEDEDNEPTRLSERVSMPRQELVTQLMNDPPIIIRPPTPPQALQVVLEVPSNDHLSFPAVPVPRGGVDRRALAITIMTFMVTLVPGLVLLHHLLSR